MSYGCHTGLCNISTYNNFTYAGRIDLIKTLMLISCQMLQSKSCTNRLNKSMQRYFKSGSNAAKYKLYHTLNIQ